MSSLPLRAFPAQAGNIGIGIQVRLGSTRLPGKAALPLGSGTVLGQCLARLSCIPASVHLILTDYSSSDQIKSMVRNSGFIVHAGDPLDVLSRYADAVSAYNLETIIRATGDNPFVFTRCIPELFKDYQKTRADYAAYQGLPLGAGVEIVRGRAILRAAEEAKDPAHREHVCPYLYEHPERFRILRPPAPQEYFRPDLRITIDSEEDYHFALALQSAIEKEILGDDLALMRAALLTETVRQF